MIKLTLIALFSLCAFADNHDAEKKKEMMEKRLEKRKEHMVTRIESRIKALEAHKDCVEEAETKEALKGCRESFREKSKATVQSMREKRMKK